MMHTHAVNLIKRFTHAPVAILTDAHVLSLNYARHWYR